MRPKRSGTALRHIAEAFRKGILAGRQNLRAMFALQAAIVVVVALYYGCPATRPFFAQLAAWQHSGGVLAAATASALAAGLLSEVCAVYFQDGGRWTRAHVENAAFKLVLFFFSGAIVFEFYRLQAFWFGDGPSFSIVAPKLFVDQFVYTIVWSVPFLGLATRWHALHYSGRQLWHELKTNLIVDRLLPVLATNWMFWIPAMALIYLLPLNLQMPVAVFGTAIWTLLLTALARQPRSLPTATAQDLLLPAAAPSDTKIPI